MGNNDDDDDDNSNYFTFIFIFDIHNYVKFYAMYLLYFVRCFITYLFRLLRREKYLSLFERPAPSPTGGGGIINFCLLFYKMIENNISSILFPTIITYYPI